MDCLSTLFRKRKYEATRKVLIGQTKENGPIYNQVSNTKYNAITFLPINLMEQFSRHMNRYFLLIACLQLVDEITPVNPLSTWGPLIFVFMVTACKDGAEDVGRRRQDHVANSKPAHVMRSKKIITITSEEIALGDLVVVREGEELPCDITLLKSSDTSGTAYLQTTNLDGETNLKSRVALKEYNELDTTAFGDLEGEIVCPAPNADLYGFDAKITQGTKSFPLSGQQFLLQGCILRNTDYVFGVAVYTGNETKVGMNKEEPKKKWSAADEQINRLAILVFALQLVIVVTLGAAGNYWKEDVGRPAWYLHYSQTSDDEDWYQVLVIPARFLLLCSLMIPISLKVTLDVAKFYYALTIHWDNALVSCEDYRALATNSTVIEDLGQITDVLTDKTGTLTKNVMTLKALAIGRQDYGMRNEEEGLKDPALDALVQAGDDSVWQLLRALCLCHSVNVKYNEENEAIYQSQSPDEDALLRGAASLHFHFVERSPSNQVTLKMGGSVELYQVLHELEFSSDRKRMSVIVQNKRTKKLTLFTKGADDMVLPRVSSEKASQEATTHLDNMSMRALRTLVICKRELTPDEYNQWNVQYSEAKLSVEKRTEKLDKVYEEIEQNLTLLGVTAIEDELQDQVPETISLLRKAGIKFWMLTGDKYMTAMQIAKSCSLFPPADRLRTLSLRGSDEGHIKKCLDEWVNEFHDGGESVGQTKRRAAQLQEKKLSVMVIDGAALNVVLEKFPFEMWEVCQRMETVICCRVTPAQKAQVTQMVVKSGARTLAIGDGGNDVNMIQEAHAGVGIAGKEGMQAARAADFAIGEFRLLSRLLLFHGRNAYARTSFIAQYSFYKSLFVSFLQIAFAPLSGWSGVSVFTSFSLFAFNTFFTSLVVVCYVLDRDISYDCVTLVPEIYADGQRSRYLSPATFMSWVMRAVYQSVFLAIFFVFAFGTHIGEELGIDYHWMSTLLYSALIAVHTVTFSIDSNYRLLRRMGCYSPKRYENSTSLIFFPDLTKPQSPSTFTWVNHLVIWGTLILYFPVMALLGLWDSLEHSGATGVLFSDPWAWLTLIICTAVCTFPAIVFQYYSLNFSNELRFHLQACDWRSKRDNVPLNVLFGRDDEHPKTVNIDIPENAPEIEWESLPLDLLTLDNEGAKALITTSINQFTRQLKNYRSRIDKWMTASESEMQQLLKLIATAQQDPNLHTNPELVLQKILLEFEINIAKRRVDRHFASTSFESVSSHFHNLKASIATNMSRMESSYENLAEKVNSNVDARRLSYIRVREKDRKLLLKDLHLSLKCMFMCVIAKWLQQKGLKKSKPPAFPVLDPFAPRVVSWTNERGHIPENLTHRAAKKANEGGG